jgi:hypothetical protein
MTMSNTVRSVLILCILVGFSTVGCSEGFQFEGGKPAIVAWVGSRSIQYLDGADPKTFRVLDSAENAVATYAMDANHVYIGVNNRAMRIESADPKTFKVLTDNGAYSADDARVYWYGVELKGADPKSFLIIKEPYGVDKERVYVGTAPIKVSSLKDFEVLRVDGVNLPVNPQMNELVLQADKKSFISGWSRDGESYYWGAVKIDGADYDSLEILNDWHAKDRSRVYYKGEPIPGVDAASFVVTGEGVIRGQDKKYEYLKGKRIGPAK